MRADGTIDKMADSYHVLTLMKISVIRPIGAPSPSKEAESRRMIIPARAYAGRCQKPISFHLHVV